MINLHESMGLGQGFNSRPLYLQSDLLLTALRGPVLNIIRIYHKFEDWIEKSIPRITVWHHKACQRNFGILKYPTRVHSWVWTDGLTDKPKTIELRKNYPDQISYQIWPVKTWSSTGRAKNKPSYILYLTLSITSKVGIMGVHIQHHTATCRTLKIGPLKWLIERRP